MAEIIKPNENSGNQNGKKKSVGKKIFQYGCLPLIGLFLISIIISIAVGTSSEKSSTSESSNTVKKDSVQLAQEQAIKDSIANVLKQEKKEAEQKLKTFKKNEDEFNETTFYRDPRTPNYTNVNFIYPYIGQQGNNYWLRLKFQYASDDWLFIKRGILLIDGEKYTINGVWDRDNNSGIWEWLDIQVGVNERIILDRLANSESAKVRYEGTQYRKDRTITSKEKDIIKNTLEIFDGVNNK